MNRHPIGDPPIAHDSMVGTDSITEAELLALEQRQAEVVAGAKRIRYHLGACQYGDAQTWADFHELLKFAGLHDEVVPTEPVTQPQAEMACAPDELDSILTEDRLYNRGD